MNNNLKIEVFERDGKRCVLCGDSIAADIHHIVFKSQGGRDEKGNLACLCRECHDAIHHGNLNSERRMVGRIVDSWGAHRLAQYFLLGYLSKRSS